MDCLLNKLKRYGAEILEHTYTKPNGEYPGFLFLVLASHPTETSFIRTELWLPDNYNGIFLGLGGGGMGGTLIEEPPEYLTLGYAVGYTDMGTSNYVSGDKLRAEADLFRDYTWRSTHITTVLAKSIIKEHYGQEPKHSYFFGESAGGLQAYSEAERYPEDYDGIIAGVSSHNALGLVTYLLWLHKALHTEDGKAIVSRDTAGRISLSAAKYFNSRGNGETGDNFITYPYLGENTVEDFIEFLKADIPELTEKELSALKLVYRGPRHGVTGEQLFAGLPLGAEMNSGSFDNEDSFGLGWFRMFLEEGYDDRDFDFSSHYEKLLYGIGRDFAAVSDDLSAFKKRGGKLIAYVGSADPAGPWAEGLKHYNSVCEKMGGYEKVKDFFKFFILPGRGHNKRHGLGLRLPLSARGGSLLDAIRAWREEGDEPEYLIGLHREADEDGNVTREFSRNVYPYKADKTKEGIDYPKCTSDRILSLLK